MLNDRWYRAWGWRGGHAPGISLIPTVIEHDRWYQLDHTGQRQRKWQLCLYYTETADAYAAHSLTSMNAMKIAAHPRPKRLQTSTMHMDEMPIKLALQLAHNPFEHRPVTGRKAAHRLNEM